MPSKHRRKNLKMSLKHPDAIDVGHYHVVVTDIFHETTYSTGRPWREGDFRQRGLGPPRRRRRPNAASRRSRFRDMFTSRCTL